MRVQYGVTLRSCVLCGVVLSHSYFNNCSESRIARKRARVYPKQSWPKYNSVHFLIAFFISQNLIFDVGFDVAATMSEKRSENNQEQGVVGFCVKVTKAQDALVQICHKIVFYAKTSESCSLLFERTHVIFFLLPGVFPYVYEQVSIFTHIPASFSEFWRR